MYTTERYVYLFVYTVSLALCKHKLYVYIKWEKRAREGWTIGEWRPRFHREGMTRSFCCNLELNKNYSYNIYFALIICYNVQFSLIINIDIYNQHFISMPPKTLATLNTRALTQSLLNIFTAINIISKMKISCHL